MHKVGLCLLLKYDKIGGRTLLSGLLAERAQSVSGVTQRCLILPEMLPAAELTVSSTRRRHLNSHNKVAACRVDDAFVICRPCMHMIGVLFTRQAAKSSSKVLLFVACTCYKQLGIPHDKQQTVMAKQCMK